VSGAEQNGVAEEVESGSAVHLGVDHLDAVDVAFNRAGTVGQGQARGDGGEVSA
jgi:hypothetical protein